MKKPDCINIILVVFTAFITSTADSFANPDWLIEIMPGTVHANLAADDFSVTSPNGKETLSIFSSMPNISAGVAIIKPQGYLDIKAGGGILLNSKISAYLANLGMGFSYEVHPGILVGPHAAYIKYFTPEWWGDTDIKFNSSNGFMAGIHIAAGDRISYLLSLDYVNAIFDIAESAENVTASHDKLDLSGVAVQFGVRAQF